MTTLNHNIPRFRCLVRSEFLYAFKSHWGEFEPGVCHAVSTLENRALGFHVLLDNGAHVGRLPIHAIVTHKAPPIEITKPWMLQMWDCFSVHAAVIEYDWLSELRCRVVLPDQSVYGGTYMYTVDYYGSETAESAGDSGWKCHHIIELDNGWIAAQPNNRVCWFEPSSVVPFDKPPDYKTMPYTWKVEDGMKWRTENSDKMFYDVHASKSENLPKHSA